MNQIQERNLQSIIKISNKFFFVDHESSNAIRIIKPLGFALYCFCLGEQGISDKFTTSINQIQYVLGIKDARTIKKGINIISTKNFIKIKNLSRHSNNITEARASDILEISAKKELTNDNGKYLLMNYNLFTDYIRKIGPNGWVILCILSMLHNYYYHDDTINNFGYANPSQKLLSDITTISRSIIIKILHHLQELNLIKILSQHTHMVQTEDETLYLRCNDKYLVYNRFPNNKYFIEPLMKQIEDSKCKYDLSEVSASASEFTS